MKQYDEEVRRREDIRAKTEALFKPTPQPSLVTRNARAITRTAGWVLIIPATVVAAISAICLVIFFVLALLDKTTWRAPLIWLGFFVVFAAIRVVGSWIAHLGRNERARR